MNFDFSDLYGVKINPQTLKNKCLCYAICKGVEFIGPFDGAHVDETSFRGSKGAKIDPQKLGALTLNGCDCCDVEFI